MINNEILLILEKNVLFEKLNAWSTKACSGIKELKKTYIKLPSYENKKTKITSSGKILHITKKEKIEVIVPEPKQDTQQAIPTLEKNQYFQEEKEQMTYGNFKEKNKLVNTENKNNDED